jgi:hypothetical protein
MLFPLIIDLRDLAWSLRIEAPTIERADKLREFERTVALHGVDGETERSPRAED